MADQKLILFSFLISTIFGVQSSVPVLLWGSESLSSLPIPLAGHSVSSNAFQKNYLEKLMPCQNCDKKSLVVFVQDKLSVEDFTHYGHVFEDAKEGGIFDNVKSFMGSHPSLSLSSVHLSANSINQLKKKFENVQEIHLPSDDVSSVKPTATDSLLVVHLPDTRGSGRVEDKLKENDGHIARVLNKYTDAGVQYTAMYTARESSKIVTNEAVFAQGRHLLAAKENVTGTAIEVKDCMLAYYTKASIIVTPKGGKSLTQELKGAPDFSKSSCENTTSENSLILTWKNAGENVTDVTVTINFNMSKTTGYWSISEMLMSYTHGKPENDVKMDGRSLFAWKGYSYHCSGIKIYQASRSNDSNDARLFLQGFQVQPFDLRNKQFSYPNDCIGFFTLPIWSGLITTFILIAILSFGMYMIANINTMDRFDDPKGKTITVNADDKS